MKRGLTLDKVANATGNKVSFRHDICNTCAGQNQRINTNSNVPKLQIYILIMAGLFSHLRIESGKNQLR